MTRASTTPKYVKVWTGIAIIALVATAALQLVALLSGEGSSRWVTIPTVVLVALALTAYLVVGAPPPGFRFSVSLVFLAGILALAGARLEVALDGDPVFAGYYSLAVALVVVALVTLPWSFIPELSLALLGPAIAVLQSIFWYVVGRSGSDLEESGTMSPLLVGILAGTPVLVYAWAIARRRQHLASSEELAEVQRKLDNVLSALQTY